MKIKNFNENPNTRIRRSGSNNVVEANLKPEKVFYCFRARGNQVGVRTHESKVGENTQMKRNGLIIKKHLELKAAERTFLKSISRKRRVLQTQLNGKGKKNRP